MTARTILITGGNGALGQAIARAFLEECAENKVWLGVRAHRDQADRLQAEFSPRCRLIDLDVTSREAWQEAVRVILASSAQLEVLVNNAGAHEDALLGGMPVDSWDRVLAANLDSVFHGCQAVLPAMISQRRGAIVNVASLSALLPPAGQTNYAAAKAGVVALTQSLAKEVARIGITVNAVCPGYLDTPALQGLSEAERQALSLKIPMRRLGRPAEVASAIRFLACPTSSYITGSILKIDGGIM